MARVTACLSLLLVFTALAAGRRENRPYRRRHEQPECVRIARNCLNVYVNKYDYLDTLPEIRSFLGNATQLAQAAEDLQEAVECRSAAAQMPSCEEYDFVFSIDMYMSAMADFLQSPGAIDDIVAASSSPCLTDEGIVEQGMMEYMGCVMTAEREVESGEICGGVRNFLNCTERGVERLCGEAAAQLLRRVRRYLFTTPGLNDLLTESLGFDISSCQNMVNVARRSAELVRPLFDRLRK